MRQGMGLYSYGIVLGKFWHEGMVGSGAQGEQNVCACCICLRSDALCALWQPATRRSHCCSEGRVGKQFFNMRLASEEVNDALSGYEHNAGACATRKYSLK